MAVDFLSSQVHYQAKQHVNGWLGGEKLKFHTEGGAGMPGNSHTIAVLADCQFRKITKVLFGRDGSYMVMVPYHSSNQGVLFKAPVTYSRVLDEDWTIPFSAVMDAGDVDKKRIKLSHHRSGLVQFSGEGVISGLDEQGNPRGIGVRSWRLDNPAPGPSFAISFLGLNDFSVATPSEARKMASEGIVFDVNELAPAPGKGFVLEGFYFPPKARRFVKSEGGKARMQIVHPVGLVMDLQVALADPSGCEFPGLIGLTVYPIEAKFGTTTSGYIVSSSTGNLRKNEKGEIVGEGIYCAFPNGMKSLARRSLDFVPASLQSGVSDEITAVEMEKA